MSLKSFNYRVEKSTDGRAHGHAQPDEGLEDAQYWADAVRESVHDEHVARGGVRARPESLQPPYHEAQDCERQGILYHDEGAGNGYGEMVQTFSLPLLAFC